MLIATSPFRTAPRSTSVIYYRVLRCCLRTRGKPLLPGSAILRNFQVNNQKSVAFLSSYLSSNFLSLCPPPFSELFGGAYLSIRLSLPLLPFNIKPLPLPKYVSGIREERCGSQFPEHRD